MNILEGNIKHSKTGSTLGYLLVHIEQFSSINFDQIQAELRAQNVEIEVVSHG